MTFYLIDNIMQEQSIKSILDYQITFNPLKDSDTHYMAIGTNGNSSFPPLLYLPFYPSTYVYILEES